MLVSCYSFAFCDKTDESLEPRPVCLVGRKEGAESTRQAGTAPCLATLVSLESDLLPGWTRLPRDPLLTSPRFSTSNMRFCLACQPQVGTDVPVSLALPSPKAQPLIPSVLSLSSFPPLPHFFSLSPSLFFLLPASSPQSSGRRQE